jgi:hypothetical protein
MNFDHWKEVLAAAAPLPDHHRADVRAATGVRTRRRAAARRRIGPSAGRNPGAPRPAVPIPRAPGYSAPPAVAGARSAFIPPPPGALVRMHGPQKEMP